VDEFGRVTLSSFPDTAPIALLQITVSDRIGNIPRVFKFPNGTQFETPHNDAVDEILVRFKLSGGSRLLHALESRWKSIVPAVLLVLLASMAFVQYGIPYAAKAVAFSVSSQTAASLDEGALDVLDKAFFEESELDEATKTRLRSRFATMTGRYRGEFRYHLQFRRGGDVGANAFALPSGTVVVTDEMVELSENDEELVAVFAHEIGHVQERHSLRRVLQDSAMLLVVSMLTGDVSNTAGVVATLPTVLVEAQYSQTFEREADAYALNYLKQNGIDPIHFKHLMLRIEGQHKDRGKVPSFFSTHPATEERVKAFESSSASKPATPAVK
jgi:Zn-dependent protease with chaperone function